MTYHEITKIVKEFKNSLTPAVLKLYLFKFEAMHEDKSIAPMWNGIQPISKTSLRVQCISQWKKAEYLVLFVLPHHAQTLKG